MSTETRDERIAAYRANLIKQRVERKDALDLPRTMTQRQVNDYVAETAALEATIANFDAKTAAYASLLPSLELDQQWREHLDTWHATLNDELQTAIRDKDADARIDRTFCIKLIDFGFAISSLGIVTLESTRIGQLMREAGYDVQGEALRGPRGWRGSVPEVEQRIKALTAQRIAAEQALDKLMLSDEQREQSQADRDALNSMTMTANSDGDGLVAFTQDGAPLSIDNMTPEQRDAFTRFERAAYPERVSV